MLRIPHHRWWGYVLLLSICWGFSIQPNSSVVQAGTPLPANVPLLAVYILAYDNQPHSPFDLTPHYKPTLQSIVTASQGRPDKLAVVLADLHDMGDTHIRIVYDGTITTMLGLPDQNGVLSTQITEYDTTDGATLGGFLRWVRQRFQSERSLLAYIGHGTPLVPETDLSAIWGTNPRPEGPGGPLPPLPTNIGANPALTDHHTPPGSALGYGVLTPYSFAEGLSQSNAGALAFDVIDVVMCFGASIEEFFEISPFANVMVGSPNYAFFDPTSPGRVLEALDATLTPQAMGKRIVDTYHSLLPPSDHPRIIAAVNSEQLNSVKVAWDELSAALFTLLTDPTQRDDTRLKLLEAYRNSIKYDLTHCPPIDWRIEAPDGLVDMRHFAVQLQQQFAGTQIQGLARTAQLTLFDEANSTGAVYHHAAMNDVPWFAPTVPPWIFEGNDPNSLDDDAIGLAIYADFEGRAIGSSVELSWHAHWYHDAAVADNPHPFAFLFDAITPNGWDEVFQAYWANEATQTAACLPSFPVARDFEPITDLSVQRLPKPSRRVVVPNQNVPLGADISTTAPIRSFLVKFEVFQNNTSVYSTVLHTGPLIRGRHFIQAPTPWIPNQLGPYSVVVSVDPDDRIIESNETNNIRRFLGEVVQREAVPEIIGHIKNTSQLIATAEVTLLLTQTNPLTPTINRLAVQYYQFERDPFSGALEPILRGRQIVAAQLPDVQLTLPPGLQPGHVVLHLWAISASGRSLEPLIIPFNYAPSGATLAPDEQDTYRFRLTRGNRVQFGIQVPQGQNADLYLWEPYIDHFSTQSATVLGNDLMQLDFVPLSGWYTLVVAGSPNQTTRYTLSAQRNAQPIMIRNSITGTGLNLLRPQFREPAIRDPWTIFIPGIQK